MRVANKTIYDSVTYNLRNRTQDMNEANVIVSTGKRINNLSDDPVGLTQALNIKSAISIWEIGGLILFWLGFLYARQVIYKTC